jgi:hypothetical protein
VTSLRRLRDLSPGDWLLLLRAFPLTVGIRLAVRLVPFRLLRRYVHSHRRAPRPGAPSVDRIAWAVLASARRVPDASCLTQALVAETLLHRAGHEAVFHLGVARPTDGAEGLEAHAWVESGGRVVVGGGELDRFTRLPVPERWRP